MPTRRPPKSNFRALRLLRADAPVQKPTACGPCARPPEWTTAPRRGAELAIRCIIPTSHQLPGDGGCSAVTASPMSCTGLKSPRRDRHGGSCHERAGIYVRISKDRRGDKLGVERQEADCRALAAEMGWEVSDLYIDDDLSAYSGRRRPAGSGSSPTCGTGPSTQCWHSTRTASTRGGGTLKTIDAVESTGCLVKTVHFTHYDLATRSGRMVARVIGAVARDGVRGQSRALLRQARRPRPPGSLEGRSPAVWLRRGPGPDGVSRWATVDWWSSRKKPE